MKGKKNKSITKPQNNQLQNGCEMFPDNVTCSVNLATENLQIPCHWLCWLISTADSNEIQITCYSYREETKFCHN